MAGHSRRAGRDRPTSKFAARSTTWSASTAAGKLVFTPVDVVRYMSDIVTLKPGDLILTGTPGGVGFGMDPPVYLHPGQVVRTSIEGIGELVNRCVAEAPVPEPSWSPGASEDAVLGGGPHDLQQAIVLFPRADGDAHADAGERSQHDAGAFA